MSEDLHDDLVVDNAWNEFYHRTIEKARKIVRRQVNVQYNATTDRYEDLIHDFTFSRIELRALGSLEDLLIAKCGLSEFWEKPRVQPVSIMAPAKVPLQHFCPPPCKCHGWTPRPALPKLHWWEFRKRKERRWNEAYARVRSSWRERIRVWGRTKGRQPEQYIQVSEQVLAGFRALGIMMRKYLPAKEDFGKILRRATVAETASGSVIRLDGNRMYGELGNLPISDGPLLNVGRMVQAIGRPPPTSIPGDGVKRLG